MSFFYFFHFFHFFSNPQFLCFDLIYSLINLNLNKEEKYEKYENYEKEKLLNYQKE